MLVRTPHLVLRIHQLPAAPEVLGPEKYDLGTSRATDVTTTPCGGSKACSCRFVRVLSKRYEGSVERVRSCDAYYGNRVDVHDKIDAKRYSVDGSVEKAVASYAHAKPAKTRSA